MTGSGRTRAGAALAGGLLAAAAAPAAEFELATGTGLPPLAGPELPQGGLATELVRTALENAGHGVEIRFVPWKRAAGMVRTGKADAAFPYPASPARTPAFSFSRPVLRLPRVAVVHRSEAGAIAAVEDLAERTACRVLGRQLPQPIRSRLAAGRTEALPRVPSLQRCLELVRAGHADFAIAGEPVARHLAAEALDTPKAFSLERYGARPARYRLIFADGAAAKRRQANEALAALKQSPVYRRIRQRHLD